VGPAPPEALEQRLLSADQIKRGAFRTLPFFLSKVFERIETTHTSLNPGGYP
jgi:hypothetical protein